MTFGFRVVFPRRSSSPSGALVGAPPVFTHAVALPAARAGREGSGAALTAPAALAEAPGAVTAAEGAAVAGAVEGGEAEAAEAVVVVVVVVVVAEAAGEADAAATGVTAAPVPGRFIQPTTPRAITALIAAPTRIPRLPPAGTGVGVETGAVDTGGMEGGGVTPRISGWEGRVSGL